MISHFYILKKFKLQSDMKKHNSFIFALIFFFITHYSLFIEDCFSQWVYQTLPTYQYVTDINFFDANTGILIYYTYPANMGMLRTTNGGFNWIIINSDIHYYDMQKIDSTSLYLVGRKLDGAVERMQRTFDRGLTWDTVSLSAPDAYSSLSFINRDTGWISGANEFNVNCIWKTINGGVTLIQQTDTTGLGKIFFLKNKVNSEYYGWHYSLNGDNKLWKTTNSGNNWFQITRPPAQYLGYFYFIDSNTGWFTYGGGSAGGTYRTINGGNSWLIQYLPISSNLLSTITKFRVINYDTIFGAGGSKWLGGGRINGIVWKTTNGGINWGYQETVDTSYHFGGGDAIYFINSTSGWMYGSGDGVHTTNGGGPIILTNIKNNNEIIAKNYILFQNFPNPFNAKSKIKYQILISADIKIKIFSIEGKEINTLINKHQSYGIYEIILDGSNFSSGVYFYSLIINEKIIDTKKLVILK